MVVENWKIESDGKLTRFFEFSDFKQAFTFMSKVAIICEKQNHHPNWENTYNKLTIRLCTHDQENKVTLKDYRLAESINNIYTGHGRLIKTKISSFLNKEI